MGYVSDVPNPRALSRLGAFAFAVLIGLSLVSIASRFWLAIRPLLVSLASS
jgi:hypothetical protein